MAWQASMEPVPTAAVGGDPEEIGVFPLDAHNAKLLDNVAPKDWVNPEVKDDFVYDLIALGAGAGCLVSSRNAARRGYKSALIEKHMAGGDCLNVGCVPSKALLRCARAIRSHSAEEKAEFGITAGEATIDFGKVMDRMRRLRAKIAPVDSFARSKEIGVDMYQGHAKFTGPNTVEVGGKTLKFRKAVVATGGSAFVPPIPGLKGTPYLTNANLFNLTEKPKKMLVLGGGPIGVEMAQAFASFGIEVTIVSSELLPREDPDAREVVIEALKKSGLQFQIGCRVNKVEHNGLFQVHITCAKGCDMVYEADQFLVATGRKPNVTGLGLEEAGVKFSPRTGIETDDLMMTSNPSIYAIGDCASKYQFTHMAGMMAQMVVDNSLFGEQRKVSDLVIPWCTYTEPEVAHVGKYEREIEGGSDTYKATLEHNDRAILEGATEGFFKIHCKKGTDEIVGATVVGAGAGEMLTELTLCIKHKIPMGLKGLGSLIHPYPTVSEGWGGCAWGYKFKTWKTVVNGKVVGGEPEAKSEAAPASTPAPAPTPAPATAPTPSEPASPVPWLLLAGVAAALGFAVGRSRL